MAVLLSTGVLFVSTLGNSYDASLFSVVAKTSAFVSEDLNSGSDCVNVAKLVAVSALAPDGHIDPLPVSPIDQLTQDWKTDKIKGRILDFDLLGQQVSQTLPPYGWTPANASLAERRVFGVSDDAPLADLSLRPADPVLPCTTGRSNSVSTTAPSSNWAGGMNVNGSATQNTFTQSAMHWTQPNFNAVCPGGSAYSIWSGLGGWNSDRLIQAGTDTVGESLTGAYFFWEMVNGNTSGVQEVRFGPGVSSGQSVGAQTKWTGSAAQFTVNNYSSGLTSTVTNATGPLGYAAVEFYDGTTSDFITESPSGGSAPRGYYYLRQPTAATRLPYAISNNAPIANFRSWRIYQTGQSGNTMQDSSYDGINAWNDTWRSCS